MKIEINGELHELDEGSRISDLVDMLGFSGRRIAVEVNLNIVPRSEHDTYVLKAGDKVEVVQAIGGG